LLLVLMMRVRLALLMVSMLLDASCRNDASAQRCLGHHDGRDLDVFARHCFMSFDPNRRVGRVCRVGVLAVSEPVTGSTHVYSDGVNFAMYLPAYRRLW
jgi:hypothetical protein